ncbi:MAG: penicillin-binding protein 2 [Gammaproteobacteria bacterium]|nr:penicillin-binding protein 2 [Gammaproteobacteria bacterium]
MPGLEIKDVFSETRVFTARSIVTGVLLLVLIGILLARLFYLQVIEYDRYSTLSKNNRISVVPRAPVRGIIFDRNGIPLARNIPSYTLEVVPDQVKDMDNLLDELGKLVKLTEYDLKLFYRDVKRNAQFNTIILRSRLTDVEAARFAVNRYRFKGVDLRARLERNYPKKESAAHVVGYVGRISSRDLERVDKEKYRGINFLGKTGIESYYEDLLRGEIGFDQVETNAHGRVVRTISSTPSVPGKNIYLTLDSELQRVAEQALGDFRGAVVAIKPSTGEILAFASTPSYDPNAFINGISTADYAVLRDSPDKPLLNRALRGRYPPGSTIKPFMGLLGLKSGISPVKKTYCPGYYRLTKGGRKFRDWKRGGHGSVNLHDAIVQSCDVYFYDLADRLGIDYMHEYLALFGFGTKTGIDLNGESSGLLPSREWKRATRNQPWYRGETVIAGIGQGYVLVTPLQLASATSALANNGIRMKPYLLLSEEDALLARKKRNEPVKLNSKIWRDKDLAVVKQAMIDVTDTPQGTARRIGINSPYKIAAKTGTAQVIGIKENEHYKESEVALRNRDHALFIAYAPAEKPEIAVAVIAENGGHGGSTAGPIARKVIDFYLLGKKPKQKRDPS